MTTRQLRIPLSLETADSHAAQAFALGRSCLPLLRDELLCHADGTLQSLARDLIAAIGRRGILKARAVHDLDALTDLLDQHVVAGSQEVARWYPGDEVCDPYCVVETVHGPAAQQLLPLLERLVALRHAVERVLDIVHAERALDDVRQGI